MLNTQQKADAARAVLTTLQQAEEAMMSPVAALEMPSAMSRHRNALSSLLELFHDDIDAGLFVELYGGEYAPL